MTLRLGRSVLIIVIRRPTTLDILIFNMSFTSKRHQQAKCMCSNIAEESGTSALDCAATEDAYAVESTLTRVQIGTFSRDWRMPTTTAS